jgi:AcrR family transcriptional regulator
LKEDTKIRILSVATTLFARKGYEATSLRDITAEADVNLAAVNYHFRSKEDLFCAVIERIIAPTSARRLFLLSELEQADRISLEGVLDAFFRPIVEVGHLPDGTRAQFLPLLGRFFTERPDLIERVFRTHLFPVGQRYLAILNKLLPHLNAVELGWRFHFMIGTLTHTLSAEQFLLGITNGAADPTDVDAVVARMVAFSAGGLRAPVPELTHE